MSLGASEQLAIAGSSNKAVTSIGNDDIFKVISVICVGFYSSLLLT